MDKRTALKKNERLAFPGMDCVIDASAGRGASVLAYTGVYPDQQDPRQLHRVLIRELFPFDPKGEIRRLENGDLLVPDTSRGLYERCRLSFLRANDVHLKMAQSIPGELDSAIGTFSLHNTLYSVLSFSGGRTLEQEISDMSSGALPPAAPESSLIPEDRLFTKADARGSSLASEDRLFTKTNSLAVTRRSPSPEDRLLRMVRILRGALEVLSAFHRAEYLHLDISPDNILLIGEGNRERVTLIDYNSVLAFDEIADPSLPLSIKEGYSAPEVRLARRDKVGIQTDLYSMTAVLWKCISGRDLSGMEWAGGRSPDPFALPQWERLPESVLSMLARILARGLAPSPKRRYRDTSQMLSDLAELEDRILGRGITRWALRESGRTRLRALMQSNPALSYIREDAGLYPVYAEGEDGTRHEIQADCSVFTQDFSAGRPVLVLGSAGTGKTTALCRAAYEASVVKRQDSDQDRSYKDRFCEAAAVFYIPLCEYRDGKETFLRDFLLEGLKFKPQTDSMETARKELLQQLDQTCINDRPAGSPAPVLFLLLDGWNEAGGDTAPLLHEIRMLASKPGVRILMTSRTDPGDPLFCRYRLCRLGNSDIRSILAQNGILPPENMEVFELLSFPILLSAYIRTAREGGRQPFDLQSREELLEKYFSAIREKEMQAVRTTPEETAGIDAVFRFLLPEIAAYTGKQDRPVTDPELLEPVGNCFQELSGKALTAVFPEWIGHTKALHLGARNADEWYGRAVLEILWKHTGLLVRGEHGGFRFFHQLMEEFLVRKSEAFHVHFDMEKRRLRTRRNFTAALAAILSALILVSAFGTYNYRMRMQITDKHTRMIEAQQEKEALELVRRSGEELTAGDRRAAVRSAADALLLAYADPAQAETALVEEDGFAGLRSTAGDTPGLGKPAAGTAPLRNALPGQSLEETPAAGNAPAETAGKRTSAFDRQDSTAARAQKALTDALGVYDLSDGFKPDFLLKLPGQPFRLFLSPEGTRVCALCPWQLLVFDTVKGEQIAALPIPQTALVQAVFLDEDRIVYAAGEAVCACDFSSGTSLWEIPRSSQAAHLALSGDRSRIAIVDGEESMVRIFDTETGRPEAEVSFSGRHLRTPFRAVTGDPMDCMLELNDDGTCLAAGFSDGSVVLYDLSYSPSYEKEADSGSGSGSDSVTVARHQVSAPSSLTHFEGGFCGDLFAWSATDGTGSFCAAADAKTGAIREEFSADSIVRLQADASGIFYTRDNLLCQWIPEPQPSMNGGSPGSSDLNTMNTAELVRAEDVITAFRIRGGQLLLATGGNRFCFYGNRESLSPAGGSVKCVSDSRAADDPPAHGNVFKKQKNGAAGYNCDFMELRPDTAVIGSMDSEEVRILKKRPLTGGDLFFYDGSYPHIEARVSTDHRTVMLYSSSGFRICSLESGDCICEETFPDAGTVYDTQYRRPAGSMNGGPGPDSGSGDSFPEKSFPEESFSEDSFKDNFSPDNSPSGSLSEDPFLEVTWYDGTVRCYSAADGSLLSESAGAPPDGSLREEFYTDHYRLVSEPGKPLAIFDRETGEELGEFHEDANLAYVTQTGAYIILEYFAMQDGNRYGLLLNDRFETLAELPGLCDIPGEELVFDSMGGELHMARIRSLQELIEAADSP